MHQNRPVPRHTTAQSRHTKSEVVTISAHRQIEMKVWSEFTANLDEWFHREFSRQPTLRLSRRARKVCDLVSRKSPALSIVRTRSAGAGVNAGFLGDFRLQGPG